MPQTATDDETLPAAIAARAAAWCQTPASRLRGSDDAVPLIRRTGIVTLYPVSPDFPNLFAAFAGPDAVPDSGHNTPSGEIHTWRWILGRRSVAFYGTAVRTKPTWVAWDVLPALVRLLGDLRSADEQAAAGLLSDDARRIANALADAGKPLATGELHQLAGFETGKERRTAYLKAITELDRRLMIGRAFGPPADPDDTGMRQTLIAVSYPDAIAVAERMDAAAAMQTLLDHYLTTARFIRPKPFARHLALPMPAVWAELDSMVTDGTVVAVTPDGESDPVYLATSQRQQGASR